MTRRSRLAFAIIDHYPRVWRDRYAHELRAMLEDAEPSSKDVFDLARGAMTEWRYELLDPERHKFASALWYIATRYWAHLLVGASLAFLPPASGRWLRDTYGSPPDWLITISIAVFLAALAWPFVARWRFTRGKTAAITWTEAACWSALMIAAFIVVDWGATPHELEFRERSGFVSAVRPWIWLWNGCYFVNFLLSRREPTPVEQARSTVGVTREKLKWARLELARLESIAQDTGLERALNAQRAEVEDLQRTLAAAYDAIRRGHRRQPATETGDDHAS